MPSMSGMLVPPDLDGLESSPSNGSTCSMLSQSKPASLPMKDVTSKDSHNSDTMTVPSMTGGIVESPPCTPQQTNRGLPMVGSNSGSQPVSTNTSPQQAPIRQMQRMRLHTMHSSPALVEKPMDMMYESYAHSPLFSHLHGMAPSGWPAAMGFAPNTSHPFSSMGMHAMATTAFINPSSTQVAGVPRGETGAYTPNNAPRRMHSCQSRRSLFRPPAVARMWPYVRHARPKVRRCLRPTSLQTATRTYLCLRRPRKDDPRRK